MSAPLGDQLSPGGIWIWKAMAQGQFQDTDGNQKDPVPSCSTVLIYCELWVGPILARYWSNKDCLTCDPRYVSTPGRPALYGTYLSKENCLIISSKPHNLSPTSCILLVILVSIFLLPYLNFPSPGFTKFVIYLLLAFGFQVLHSFIDFFHFIVSPVFL